LFAGESVSGKLERPKIISVSRREDVPAFRAEEFYRKLRAGSATYRHPFRADLPPLTVSLKRENIAAFAFWSKNFSPLLLRADELKAFGAPAIFHYTINAYPKAFERNVPPLETHLAAAQTIAEKFGVKALCWRYDPIFFSDATPPNWHEENFSKIASSLRGLTDVVYTSYISLYRKTERALARLNALGGPKTYNPPFEQITDLVKSLSATAEENGIKLVTCASPKLAEAGFAAGACIDADRLVALGMDASLSYNKTPTREGWLCRCAVDIGEYGSCKGGCLYCYATNQS